jgi:large subunit ribosomal protein L21
MATTYAIVKTGGKQYRVEPGQHLLVERLAAEVGATVSLEPLLYRSEKVAFDEASLARVKVSAKVLGHERGPKLRVFKFKPKRGYKRRTGHRQELTRIEVGEITSGPARARSATRDQEPARRPTAARRPAGRSAKPDTASKPASTRTRAGGQAASSGAEKAHPGTKSAPKRAPEESGDGA